MNRVRRGGKGTSCGERASLWLWEGATVLFFSAAWFGVARGLFFDFEVGAFDGGVLVEADIVDGEGAGIVFGDRGLCPSVEGEVEDEVVAAVAEGVGAVALGGVV